MSEKHVSLDSLRFDTVLLRDLDGVERIDDDIDLLLAKVEEEVAITLADAAGTLFAARALSRRIVSTNR